MKRFKDFIKEDAPANNVGDGQIAGLGVGPKGEPGRPGKIFRRKKKSILPEVTENTFMGSKVFNIKSDEFHNNKFGKKNYSRWNNISSNEELKTYGRKTRKSIVVSDEKTGYMYFLRQKGKHATGN